MTRGVRLLPLYSLLLEMQYLNILRLKSMLLSGSGARISAWTGVGMYEL